MRDCETTADSVDLLVVGGGINGAGIARDAAGRGLRVALCDAGDFAGATSSASTKLIHGGLRYLEHYEFRLVAESLAERDILARTARHLVRPLRFVLPHVPGLRPAFLIAAGLFLYDRIGRLKRPASAALPRAASCDLAALAAAGELPLRADLRRAFAYSDLAVDDARLVIANLVSAAELGARVMPRTRFVGARRDGSRWHAELQDTRSGTPIRIVARGLINAAGPWVLDVLGASGADGRRAAVRLVRGSHLVLRRANPGTHAYLLQNDDRRVVFLIPYRERYTLLGTTETTVPAVDTDPAVTATETAYLLAAANRYLRTPVAATDVVHTFWGVRPLFDDGRHDPSAVTRDYRLLVDDAGGAPCVSIFGGKLTTYRALAETVLRRLPTDLRGRDEGWTRETPLPGSDGCADPDTVASALAGALPGLDPAYAAALAGRYGSRADSVLAGVRDARDLGRRFTGQISAREVEHLVAHEWAMTAEDLLWRRTKAGLDMSADERQEFADWFARRGDGR